MIVASILSNVRESLAPFVAKKKGRGVSSPLFLRKRIIYGDFFV